MAKRILVVDDEPAICSIVKEVLEPEGFEVLTALNGLDGLEKLRKEKVGLVLIDFFMPRMSGRALLERIRADPKLKTTKVAFLTAARFGDMGVEKIHELAALDYIQKPFEVEDFVNRVKQMLSK